MVVYVADAKLSDKDSYVLPFSFWAFQGTGIQNMERTAFSPNPTWTMCSDSASSNRSDFYPLEGIKIFLAEQASVNSVAFVACL